MPDRILRFGRTQSAPQCATCGETLEANASGFGVPEPDPMIAGKTQEEHAAFCHHCGEDHFDGCGWWDRNPDHEGLCPYKATAWGDNLRPSVVGVVAVCSECGEQLQGGDLAAAVVEHVAKCGVRVGVRFKWSCSLPGDDVVFKLPERYPMNPSWHQAMADKVKLETVGEALRALVRQ